jgi:hypothetical protein
VTIGEETKTLHENQSIYIPIGAKHRLEDPGKINFVTAAGPYAARVGAKLAGATDPLHCLVCSRGNSRPPWLRTRERRREIKYSKKSMVWCLLSQQGF